MINPSPQSIRPIHSGDELGGASNTESTRKPSEHRKQSTGEYRKHSPVVENRKQSPVVEFRKHSPGDFRK